MKRVVLLAALAPIVSHVHNAPGWQPNHVYPDGSTSPYSRVVNGPGWNWRTGHFVPYYSLAAYQLTSGKCTSGPSGGPASTGTAIQDGTCVWRFRSRVDYVTLTDWVNDARKWVPGAYSNGANTASGAPLTVLYQTNGNGCTSKVNPNGVAGAQPDGCVWSIPGFNYGWGSTSFPATITYTSGRSAIPTQTYAAGQVGKALDRRTGVYEAMLWNDREYVNGQNGEANQIVLHDHHDRHNDGNPAFISSEPGAPTGRVDGNGYSSGYPFVITAAPGESFADRRGPLVGYDQTRGVGLHLTGGSDSALRGDDNYIIFQRLQVKSDASYALSGVETRSCNYCELLDSVVDGGGPLGSHYYTPIAWGASPVIANSLIITRGQVGIVYDYTGVILHSTIVYEGFGWPVTVGVETNYDWIFPGMQISSSVFVGFNYVAAQTIPNPSYPLTWLGGNNFTDAPSGNAGVNLGNSTFNGAWPVVSAAPSIFTYGTVPANDFVAYPGDLRLKKGSPLAGAGAAYGVFSNCPTYATCPTPAMDTPDIYGTPRPGSTSWDAGAWQTP